MMVQILLRHFNKEKGMAMQGYEESASDMLK